MSEGEHIRTIRTNLWLLLAFKVNGRNRVRSKLACWMIWGWREHRRPPEQYIDPRVLAGEMAWNDPAQRRA
jgi:hypothetical protein